jgi:hypothetical protein
MSGRCHADRCQKHIDYSNQIEVNVNAYWRRHLRSLREKHNPENKKKLEIEDLNKIIEKSKLKLSKLEEMNYINLLQRFYNTTLEAEIKFYSNVIKTCLELIKQKENEK